MPNINDVVRTTFVIVVDGVATTNTFYWKITQNVITNTFTQTLQEWISSYWTKLVLQMSDQSKITCVEYSNLMGTEPDQPAFLTLFGNELDPNLPVNNVMNVTQQGINAANELVSRTVAISGFSKAGNMEGHWLPGYEEMGPFQFWLVNETTLPGGLAFVPGLIHPLTPPAFEFVDAVGEFINPHVGERNRRDVGLCEAAP